MNESFGGPQQLPDASGMGISGIWVNKYTGQQITVRDAIIDGDSMTVITDQGQIDMMEFSNNYIQMSDDVYDKDGHKIGTASEMGQGAQFSGVAPAYADYGDNVPQATPMPGQGFPGVDPEDMMPKNELPKNEPPRWQEPYKLEGLENPAPMPPERFEPVAERKLPEYFSLLDKLFNKTQVKPQISVSIDYTTLPLEQLKMLTEYFDVTPANIAEYFAEKFMNGEAIMNECLTYFNMLLGIEPQSEVVPEAN